MRSKDTGALTEVSLLILLSLYEPRHGYAMMQYIEKQTDGRLKLGAGSLYGAINNLAAKEWIVSLSAADSRRVTYQITPQGQQVVQSELRRLRQLLNLVEKTIGGEHE